ncbi:MAG: carbon-nitrogen hydrolase family protein [Polaribacter sp.]
MKICIAQTKSIKGDVKENIKNHLRIIDFAIHLNADLILFPELSITGYEPELAKELATHINDKIFNPFQKTANKNNLVIGIGMPTKAIDGAHISMLIFKPKKDRVVYSKQILHKDELAYFISGTQQLFLNVLDKKIAIGICYETLQREHFVNAVRNKSDIYIASVAKPNRGLKKAYLHFPEIANEFEIPILMANCVGYCDNFLSNGKSSIWDHKGKLIEQLDEENQGILIYDTVLRNVEKVIIR